MFVGFGRVRTWPPGTHVLPHSPVGEVLHPLLWSDRGGYPYVSPGPSGLDCDDPTSIPIHSVYNRMSFHSLSYHSVH